jgi:hypothetical protein
MAGALGRVAPVMHAPTSSAQAAALGRGPCVWGWGGGTGRLDKQAPFIQSAVGFCYACYGGQCFGPAPRGPSPPTWVPSRPLSSRSDGAISSANFKTHALLSALTLTHHQISCRPGLAMVQTGGGLSNRKRKRGEPTYDGRTTC